jgi:hypothetical protein
MKKFALAVLLSALVVAGAGCSLIPKKVEFFQDKVHKFPVATETQKELQREVAQKANEKASDTLHAALAEGSSTNVLAPAVETEKLTAVVAESVGAPAKPTANLETDRLVNSLRAQIAKLEKKVDSFAEDNNQNAGKKIEGTGLISVPYFLYAGGVVLVLFIFWHLAKTALTVASAANPGAAVGVGAMNVAGTLAGKGFTQVVAGGKSFLSWVEKEVSDPALKAKIADAFTTAQKTAQDHDVKAVVDNLIK